MIDMDERLIESWTPVSRAACVVRLLFDGSEVPQPLLQERLGYGSANGLRFLMDQLSSASVPVYEPRNGYWAMLK